MNRDTRVFLPPSLRVRWLRSLELAPDIERLQALLGLDPQELFDLEDDSHDFYAFASRLLRRMEESGATELLLEKTRTHHPDHYKIADELLDQIRDPRKRHGLMFVGADTEQKRKLACAVSRTLALSLDDKPLLVWIGGCEPSTLLDAVAIMSDGEPTLQARSIAARLSSRDKRVVWMALKPEAKFPTETGLFREHWVWPTDDRRLDKERLNVLAHDLAIQLTGPTLIESLGSIVIGEVADAEHFDRLRLELDLLRFGVNVFSSNRHAEDQGEALRDALASAQIFIQLLGESPAPNGVLASEAREAAALNVRILRWTANPLSASDVDDEFHKAIVGDHEVAACSLETFRDQVIEVLRSLQPSATEEPQDKRQTVIIAAPPGGTNTVLTDLKSRLGNEFKLEIMDGQITTRDERKKLQQRATEAAGIFLLPGADETTVAALKEVPELLATNLLRADSSRGPGGKEKTAAEFVAWMRAEVRAKWEPQVNQPAEPLTVFSIYSQADKQALNLLKKKLFVYSNQLKYVKLWDDQEIVGGDDFVGVIAQRLYEADVVLIMFTDDLLLSSFAGIEQIAAQNPKKTIVPVYMKHIAEFETVLKLHNLPVTACLLGTNKPIWGEGRTRNLEEISIELGRVFKKLVAA